jgi:hypothetical protein
MAWMQLILSDRNESVEARTVRRDSHKGKHGKAAQDG